MELAGLRWPKKAVDRLARLVESVRGGYDLRLAEQSDFPEVLQMVTQECFEVHGQIETPGKLAEFVHRGVVGGQYTVFLCTKGTHIVGMVSCALVPSQPWLAGETAMVFTFYVKPGHRRKTAPVAKLMQAVKCFADESGAVRISVTEPVGEEVRLWERFGFEPVYTTLICEAVPEMAESAISKEETYHV